MIAVTYVGHATVRLELDGTTLLTDPVLRRRVAHLRRIAPPPAREAVRGPDAVLVSHAHLDHLDRRSLRLLGRCPVVAPRGCAGALARAGVRDIRPLAAGEALRVGTVEVRALAAAHDGRRHPLSRQRDVRAGGDSAAKPHHAKLPLLLRSLTRIAISLGRGEPSVGRRLSACGCETVLDPAADVGRLRADERLPERVRPRDLT
jgi:L-ascorbate metabolism protein UlaG (beta-lactamase superfamily)